MTAPVKLNRIHHVAYRCKDAKATADWSAHVLGMEFTTAFAEDEKCVEKCDEGADACMSDAGDDEKKQKACDDEFEACTSKCS